MHSPHKSDFDALRSAMWLVLDLIDDLTEDEELGEQFGRELGKLRSHAMDILFDARAIEKSRSTPSPAA